MRVIVLIKSTAYSEAGIMPSTELIDAMGNYNQTSQSRNHAGRRGDQALVGRQESCLRR